MMWVEGASINAAAMSAIGVGFGLLGNGWLRVFTAILALCVAGIQIPVLKKIGSRTMTVAGARATMIVQNMTMAALAFSVTAALGFRTSSLLEVAVAGGALSGVLGMFRLHQRSMLPSWLPDKAPEHPLTSTPKRQLFRFYHPLVFFLFLYTAGRDIYLSRFAEPSGATQEIIGVFVFGYLLAITAFSVLFWNRKDRLSTRKPLPDGRPRQPPAK